MCWLFIEFVDVDSLSLWLSLGGRDIPGSDGRRQCYCSESVWACCRWEESSPGHSSAIGYGWAWPRKDFEMIPFLKLCQASLPCVIGRFFNKTVPLQTPSHLRSMGLKKKVNTWKNTNIDGYSLQTCFLLSTCINCCWMRRCKVL